MTSPALFLSVATLLSGARAAKSCTFYSDCEPFLVVGDAEAQSRAEYVWSEVTLPPPEMPDKEDYQCGNIVTLEIEESGSSFTYSTQRKCFCGDASRNPCDPEDLEQTCSCMYSRRPPQTQAPVTAAPSISIEPSSSLAPTPTPPPAKIGPSVIYLDQNEDGIQDVSEVGLHDIDVALHCIQNGVSSQLVANATTDSNGTYAFVDVTPNQACYVEVMLENNTAGLSFCSPVTEGNFVGYDGKTAAVDVESGESYDWPGALCQALATIGPSLVFLDSNQDGLFDMSTNSSDQSLAGHKLELYCSRNGSRPTLAATNATDFSGFYEFNNIEPGECYIQHVANNSKPIYSPIVDGGGNQADENGQTRSVLLTYGQARDLPIGLYGAVDLQEDTGACGQCLDLDENGSHDCGWGIWNDCTCQCDCSPGVCLSADQKCYDGCTTHEDFNPFGGCEPGVDCPWYPSKLGESHCESSQNFAGIYNLRETAELCCKQYFSSLNLATCIQASEADVLAEEGIVAFKATRPKRYYPDMFAKQNCVYDSDYYDWMEGDNEDYFLFSSEKECCDRWYPARSDCPELLIPTSPHQVDYKQDKDEGFFYPHLEVSNCRFGRNYPMWMDNVPEHYLYTTPEECCSTWYPRESDCPLAGDDGVQDGEYWVVDYAFYPNWKGDGCAEGSDWPEWMADPTQKEYHLFKTAKECCDLWFPDHTELCQDTIVGPTSGRKPNTDIDYNGGTWYPSLNGDYDCLKGTPPDWMLQDGYKDQYSFDSHAECCKAHYCAEIRGVVQS